MNIDEKNPSQNESVEETVEIQETARRGLPLGALIGIIAGAVAVVVAVVLIILLGGKGNKCDAHVDADDDYLCDKCGESYNDGDEVVVPEGNKVEVTFTVKLDKGNVLSDVKFVLTRKGQTLELISGTDGSVKANLEVGNYYLNFDQETLPEYCICNLPGIVIAEDTTSIELEITDNRPDGSERKPFPVTTTTVELEIGAGQELYYSCHGTNIKYLTILSKDLVVKYNGETYHSPVDGEIKVTISSSNVETPSIFSIKNVSDATVKTTMEFISPLGSDDNPIKITQNNLTALVENEKTVYYVFTADENGILVVDGRTEGISISITRYITKVVDNIGEEQEIIIPVLTSADKDTTSYTYVRKGEQVKIGVSFAAPKNITIASNNKIDSTIPYRVHFGVNTYAGDETDPAPITNSNISLLLDAGNNVVFSAELGKTVEITDGKLNIIYNGSAVQPSGSGKSDITLTDNKLFSVKNNYDEVVNSYLSAISPEGMKDNPISLENNGAHVTIPANKTIYYSLTTAKSGALAFSGYADGCDITLTRKLIKLIRDNEAYGIEVSHASLSTTPASPVYLHTLVGDVIIVAITNNNDTDVDLDLTYELTAGMIPYTATVKDYNGNPVSNAEILFTPEEENGVHLLTDSEGRATYLSDKNVNITVYSLPVGYVEIEKSFDEFGNLSVEVDSNPIIIKVVDQYGNPVEGVFLQMLTVDIAFVPKRTGENGEVNYSTPYTDHDYFIRIAQLPDGYALPDGNDEFAIEKARLTIVLTKSS